jgi:hypothetical protein
MIRVFVEEEYGYAHATWVFPGTEEELNAWWQKTNEPEIAFLSIGSLKRAIEEQGLGYICPLLALPENNYEPFPKEGSVPYIHLHTYEDTYLQLTSDYEKPEIILNDDDSCCGMRITLIDDCFSEFSNQPILQGTDVERAWRKFVTKNSCMPKSRVLPARYR